MEKTCTKCQKVLPVEDFHIHKANKDGHHSRCKACRAKYRNSLAQKARDQKYWAKNGNRLLAEQKAIRAAKRGPRPVGPWYEVLADLSDRLVGQLHLDPDGCWLFQGSLTDRGYGRVRFTPNGPYTRLHRYSYEQVNGPIPDGMHVLHKCDVRNCCNPDHLFLGDQDDNMQDMIQKGRAAWQ